MNWRISFYWRQNVYYSNTKQTEKGVVIMRHIMIPGTGNETKSELIKEIKDLMDSYVLQKEEYTDFSISQIERDDT